METNTPKRADFIPYPTNRVVGTVEDAHQARAAVDALLAAGFDREDIDVLRGETGEQRLAPEGADYGFLAQFQRTLIRAARQAEEYKHLMRHLDDVRAGRFVIMVLARQRDQRTVAADILNAHGADFVGFYGRWAWQTLAPDAAAGDERENRHAVASHADEIPSRFVEAWNARDPDALASLFDEDAEFVNVTGLWWHNQHAIRDAHAYGLERIFNNSTLSIEETRVKQLGDNLAVVHARMTLSGQSPVGTIERPGSRTNIISFVVHRSDGVWRCASAHNTDVVPRMETNVIDEEGRLRSANYRSGQLSG